MRHTRTFGGFLVAAALAFLTTAAPAFGVAGFGDVEPGRFYTTPVQWMAAEGITTGTSPTCFSPDHPVTRGQAAAFLWRIEGSPTGAPAHPFVDVVSGWQQPAVSWMAAEGITTGTTPRTFSPDDPLTRGQMAALVHRAAGEPAARATGFPDVVRDWQRLPVGWMEAEGITTGTSQTTFSPEALVTRGQFATFAYRWKGSPRVTLDPASPACGNSGPAGRPDRVLAIDWWGCWRGGDARGAGGATPTDGSGVVTVPNCASGPSSVGRAGDLTSPNAAPAFRRSVANGSSSIEFEYNSPPPGDTMLQTNNGAPWSGSDVLDGDGRGVTLAWIGMLTDVESHTIKYLVSGLDSGSPYPQLIAEGDGVNRFQGWGGGGGELRAASGTIVDRRIHGVILHLAPNGTSSRLEVDGVAASGGQNSSMSGDVRGLTIGNLYSGNFSTTDHQFMFLGLHEGPLTGDEKADFWAYVDDLRS